MAKVMVYAFTSEQASEQGHGTLHVKATREAIEKIPGATMIELSAEEVEERELDARGFYRTKRMPR